MQHEQHNIMHWTSPLFTFTASSILYETTSITYICRRPLLYCKRLSCLVLSFAHVSMFTIVRNTGFCWRIIHNIAPRKITRLSQHVGVRRRQSKRSYDDTAYLAHRTPKSSYCNPPVAATRSRRRMGGWGETLIWCEHTKSEYMRTSNPAQSAIHAHSILAELPVPPHSRTHIAT